ncbi:MAG: polysaccharide transporter, family [Blastocatellia bacterium]|jgi:O-antigen/teichoic acid export membrane protein|nr:polysaccharide transporter, family [Blastocatellia bacterium]
MSPLRLTETSPVEIITDLTGNEDLSLGKRVRSGVSWNVSSSLIAEVIRFLRSIVLARLVAPEDFGLFGMALTVVAALNALTTIGLDRTILANRFGSRSELEAHLDTVWSAELIRSVIIAVVVSVLAFPLARFYGQAQLLLLIPVLGLTSLVQGFRNIGLVLLRKEISFARIFWYELATNVGGMALTVGLALFMRSVWALVNGLLITAVLGTALSYVFHSYRPRLAFEKVALRRVLNLGKFSLVIAVALYVMNMADNVMVGRFLGTNALGNYSLAFNIASAPISVVVFALGGVLVPAYAEITAQHSKRLAEAFTKVFSIASVAMLTITVALFLLAGEIVQMLFGDRWAGAGTVLRVLALIIPLRGLTLIISTVFLGLNRPRDVAVGQTLEAVVFLIFLYPFIKVFGLTGAAWAGVIAYAFACANRLAALSKIIPGITSKLFRISLSTVAAAVAGLLIAGFSLTFLTSPFPRVIIGGLLSMTIPPAIVLLVRADLRTWVVELFS